MEHVNEQWQEALVKYLVKESSPAEIKLVEQWLDSAPENRAYFSQLQKTWEQSRKLAPALSIREEDAWERFRQKLRDANETRPPLHRLSWFKIAAIFILVAGCGWLGWHLLLHEGKPVQVAAGNRLMHYTLPDGSLVTLNKQAVISYADGFSGKDRKVILKGEAFFDVSADVKRPFIVHTDEVEIKVLGTSFNVRSDKGLTEVIVETGRVAVSSAALSIVLNEKEKSRVQAGAATLRKEAVNNSLYNYYRSNRFVCEATPLRDLVATLNEAYHVNIVIENEKLGELPLTTTFSTESLDKILEIIKQTFDIRIEKENDLIILK